MLRKELKNFSSFYLLHKPPVLILYNTNKIYSKTLYIHIAKNNKKFQKFPKKYLYTRLKLLLKIKNIVFLCIKQPVGMAT